MSFTRYMLLAGLSPLVAACVSQSSQPGPATMNTMNSGSTVNSGAASAYQGTVGDWALGRWDGLYFYSGNRASLSPTDGYLLVEKRSSDGFVTCKAGAEGQLRTMRSCSITATTIDVVGPTGNFGHLDRAGADELTGTWTFATVTGTRFDIHLKRAP
jgi:hypothetical protein